MGFAEFRVILGPQNLRGDSVLAQARNLRKKTRFLSTISMLVRPFSSRSREENQNDLTQLLLYICDTSLRREPRSVDESFLRSFFPKKATSPVFVSPR